MSWIKDDDGGVDGLKYRQSDADKEWDRHVRSDRESYFENLQGKHSELVSAVREMLSSYDEWRKPEQGCVSTCDFWERLDKLEELVK